jgi:hypothetical protein
LSPQEMEQFKNACVKIQACEDQLVMVLMGRKCLWERLYFSFVKKDRAKARRRLGKEGVEAVIEGKSSQVYYYSPREIKQFFKGDYWHMNTKPVGFFVPPSYLEQQFQKRKGLFYVLKFLDRTLGNFSFLSNYADHYIIFFEKRS